MAVKSRRKRKISPQGAQALWDPGVRWIVNVISKRMYENKQTPGTSWIPVFAKILNKND